MYCSYDYPVFKDLAKTYCFMCVYLAGKLELFTHKFKERLVSMVMDKDNDVAIQSCHLMTNIYRVFPTLLTVKDCIPIYEQVRRG